MISYLNVYLESGFKLISIYEGRVFVFEKDGRVHLSRRIKTEEDGNKKHIGINSLRESVDLILESSGYFNNVASYDFILENKVTQESIKKFFSYLEEKNKKEIRANFCGIVKLRSRLNGG